MFLNPAVNGYHCFSCHEHGLLTRLLVDKLDMGVFEALDYISKEVIAGYSSEGREEDEFEVEKSWIIEPSEIFSSRGITDEIQEHFKVGMTKDGWTAVPYYFADELVGVQYRKGLKKSERQMMNSKGFKKSLYIYNYDPSQPEATIVEGYTDVFRLEQLGFHSEGLWGTSFSEEQAELLSAHKTLYLATDNDSAGRRTLEIIKYRMSGYQTKIKVVPYLEKDPGECVSRRKWLKYKSESTSYEEYSYAMSMLDEDYVEMKENVIKTLKH